MENMFDKLLHLPLFQGVSHERLHEIVEKVPFHFLKYRKGEKIIERGDDCSHVRFVISGRVQVEFESRALKFKIPHELEAPEVISPDYLYGLNTSYPFSMRAVEDCGILQVAKNDYIAMLQTDKICLLNILNYLSRNSQAVKTQLLNVQCAAVAERLVMIVSAFTTQKSQKIVIESRQRDLCRLLGARRPALMSALELLGERNLIELRDSSVIAITDRKQLLELLNE